MNLAILWASYSYSLKLGRFHVREFYYFIYESVSTCSYERQGEGGAHISPWRRFKERALYLAMKFGKFRIWYLYGLYKIEKALPEGKTKSMEGISQLKNGGRGKAEVRTFPLWVGLKKNITKTLDQWKENWRHWPPSNMNNIYVESYYQRGNKRIYNMGSLRKYTEKKDYGKLIRF